MIKFLIPVVFVVAAIGLFFGYIDPTYLAVKELKAKNQQYSDALDKSKELQAVRDRLLSKYNAFRGADLDRLQKLLPDAIDNVRLILDLDNMATRYSMRTRNVTISNQNPPKEGTVGPEENRYGTATITFSVIGSYDTFLAYLRDLESSLRLVDITSILFTVGANSDLNQYTISVKTYWLK